MRPSAKHSAKTVPTLRDMTTCQRQRTTKKQICQKNPQTYALLKKIFVPLQSVT